MCCRRIAFALLLGMSVLPLVNCQAIRDLHEVVASSDRPEIRLHNVQLRGLTLSGATLDFDVEVLNPYDVALPLLDASYNLASKGDPFLNGEAELERLIPASGSAHVTLPVTVTFAGLLDALKGVQPGAVIPYIAELDFSVDAPAIGRIGIPVRHRGELPVPTPPSVELGHIEWTEIGLSNVGARLTLNVTNLNDFPVDLEDLGINLALAGTSVADAGIKRSTQLTSGREATLEIPISFSPNEVGLAVLSIVRGSEASYDLRGTLEGTTPFGPLQLPFEKSGRTSLSR